MSQGLENIAGIDIGGTFTDCYVRVGDRVAMTKAPTTNYDLSISFMEVLEQAADELGMSLEDLLEQVTGIRYSTTMAVNKLLQRKGAPLGLIATSGFEDVIYIGKGSSWQDGLVVREKKRLPLVKKALPLIPRERVIGVLERVDSSGKVVAPLDESDFRLKLHGLVDAGVRGFVVALMWSPANDIHECRVKEIIQEEYPDFCLGGMPVVLSSEVLPKAGEYSRIMTTILSAYLHQSMSEELSGIYDRLRESGHYRPLKMVHNTGGMADMFSTTAVQTYSGGPVAGLIGSAHIAKTYGTPNAIVTDMGGTSFDLGLVIEGSTRAYAHEPIIDRWEVGLTLLETQSIGAGGGSIAWRNEDFNRLEVGPQAAGSEPGPACYDLGGEQPTVTDADLVLGYLNPNYYAGGRIDLNVAKARNAIRDKIARPFGLEIEEAAWMIKKITDANMGNAVFKETALRGFDPREFMMFAYGGAGPTHCAGYSQFAGCEKVYVFPFSPVFCAFGSTVMDLVRIYEQSKHVPLRAVDTKENLLDFAQFNEMVKQLKERAVLDLEPEGFKAEDAIFELQLDMRFTGLIHVLRANSPRLVVANEADSVAIAEQFIREYGQVYSPLAVDPHGGIDIDNFVLKVTVPQAKPQFPTFAAAGSSPQAAFKGKRPMCWDEGGTFVDTSTYDGATLQSGNVIEGPAVIESEQTTVVVPPTRKYSIDQYGNGVLEANS